MSDAVCCSRMREDLSKTCDQHPDRYDCPDSLIAYWPSSDSYGIIIHDGGASVVTIAFCPWCGSSLKSHRLM